MLHRGDRRVRDRPWIVQGLLLCEKARLSHPPNSRDHLRGTARSSVSCDVRHSSSLRAFLRRLTASLVPSLAYAFTPAVADAREGGRMTETGFSRPTGTREGYTWLGSIREETRARRSTSPKWLVTPTSPSRTMPSPVPCNLPTSVRRASNPCSTGNRCSTENSPG